MIKKTIGTFLEKILGEFMTTTIVLYDKPSTNKPFSIKFMFPTPDGFPIMVDIIFNFRANAKVDLGIWVEVLKLVQAQFYLLMLGNRRFWNSIYY